LTVHRQVGDEVRRKTNRTADRLAQGRKRVFHEGRIGLRRNWRVIEVFQHAASQVTETPCDVARVVDFVVARQRRFVHTTDSCLQHRRLIVFGCDLRQRNGDIAGGCRHLHDPIARRCVALQVSANEIRTGRQVAQSEPSAPVGDAKCAGTAERGNNRSGKRLRTFVDNDTA
jgi:hypothetical protein